MTVRKLAGLLFLALSLGAAALAGCAGSASVPAISARQLDAGPELPNAGSTAPKVKLLSKVIRHGRYVTGPSTDCTAVVPLGATCYEIVPGDTLQFSVTGKVTQCGYAQVRSAFDGAGTEFGFNESVSTQYVAPPSPPPACTYSPSITYTISTTTATGSFEIAGPFGLFNPGTPGCSTVCGSWLGPNVDIIIPPALASSGSHAPRHKVPAGRPNTVPSASSSPTIAPSASPSTTPTPSIVAVCGPVMGIYGGAWKRVTREHEQTRPHYAAFWHVCTWSTEPPYDPPGSTPSPSPTPAHMSPVAVPSPAGSGVFTQGGDTSIDTCAATSQYCIIQGQSINAAWQNLDASGKTITWQSLSTSSGGISASGFTPTSTSAAPNQTTQTISANPTAPPGAYQETVQNQFSDSTVTTGLAAVQVLCSVKHHQCLRIVDVTHGQVISSPAPQPVPTVIVGQNVVLAVQTLGTSATPTSISWKLPASPVPIAGYNFPSPSPVVGVGPASVVALTNTSSPQLSLYWYRAGAPDVKVNVTINGQVVSASALLNVFSPSATMTAAPQSSVIMTQRPPATPEGTVTLEFGASMTAPGITINGSVTPPLGADGEVAAVQLIDRCARLTTSSGTSYSALNTENTFYLDNFAMVGYYDTNGNPVPIIAQAPGGQVTAWGPFSDDPANSIGGTFKGWHAFTQTDHFTTYLMYRSNAANAIWVSLASEQWKWSGTASYSGKSSTWTLKTPATQYAVAPATIDNTLPVWTNVFSNSNQPSWGSGLPPCNPSFTKPFRVGRVR